MCVFSIGYGVDSSVGLMLFCIVMLGFRIVVVLLRGWC